MKAPNLFILGAPKCGTTSLFNALAKHPQVVPSSTKEPHFYSKDFFRPERISRDKYLSLFDNDSDEKALYWMDGSTRYLYSDVAFKAIREDVANPRLVVSLRNPADLLCSLHNHLVFLGIEKEKNFNVAWKKSFDHDKKCLIREGCSDPDSLNYPVMGLLGQRINVLKKHFESESILTVFYEDILTNPKLVEEGILEFLSLDSCASVIIGHDNKAMARKSELLFRLTRMAASTKKKIGLKSGFGFLSYLDKKNRVTKENKSISKEIRCEILSYFDQDILLLQHLTGRDLSSWRIQ